MTSWRNALLDWYRARHRDLPWRATRDPYRILVSEVMLQQTRVETVRPYYLVFVARFPTLEALAAASEEEVLAVWSGLGYYRRARSLHTAARQVVLGGGRLPATAEQLALLPGVGPYTAAAVASIAFAEPIPAVDGNAERVLVRLLALADPPRRRPGHEAVHRLARELLDPRSPGDSNQALMELGATLCRPRHPRCNRCPLGSDCRGRASGDPESFPRRTAQRPQVLERRLVAVAESAGRVLLFRRPDGSAQLAGTWELPWVRLAAPPCGPPEPGLTERYGGSWSLDPGRRLVRHAITFRRLELEVRRARFEALEDAVADGPEAGWFSAAERAGLPLSSMVGKCLVAVAEPPSLRGG